VQSREAPLLFISCLEEVFSETELAPVLWVYGTGAVGSALGITVVPARRIDRRMRVLGNLLILQAFEGREQDG
jgi:hypothetical protein